MNGAKHDPRYRKQKRILVVDNHPVVLKYMRRLLEKRGDRVETAEDGLSALKRIETFRPDILFVDQVMPNISGDKLCRILRSRPGFEDVCIIILSAVAAEAEFDFGDYDADYCIAKGPFDKMSKHILALLYDIDAMGRCGSSDEIIGLEDVYFRQISRELLNSKKHAEVILNHLTEGVVELTLEGEVVYANPTALRIIGLREEALLARSFPNLFEGNDRRTVASLLRISPPPPGEPKRAAVTLNGREVLLQRVFVAAGAHRAVTVILNDMGLRRDREPAADAGRSPASVARELDAPLQAVISLLDSLRKKAGTAPDILSDLDRIRATVEPLLDRSRPGGKRQP